MTKGSSRLEILSLVRMANIYLLAEQMLTVSFILSRELLKLTHYVDVRVFRYCFSTLTVENSLMNLHYVSKACVVAVPHITTR